MKEIVKKHFWFLTILLGFAVLSITLVYTLNNIPTGQESGSIIYKKIIQINNQPWTFYFIDLKQYLTNLNDAIQIDVQYLWSEPDIPDFWAWISNAQSLQWNNFDITEIPNYFTNLFYISINFITWVINVVFVQFIDLILINMIRLTIYVPRFFLTLLGLPKNFPLLEWLNWEWTWQVPMIPLLTA